MQRSKLARVVPFTYIVTAAVLLAIILVPAASAATTVTITPNNMSGWGFVQETAGNWTGAFQVGPGTPPLGEGSVRMTVDGTAGFLFGAQLYAGTRLADIQVLNYSTYVTTGSGFTDVTFQINYDPDVTTTEATWYGRLVYEPYFNGTVSTGAWQTWDMINAGGGKWWASNNANSPVDDVCGQSSPCTWNYLITNWPNIGIRSGSNTGIQFKAGSAWTGGFDGNVDNLNVQISGNLDTYDFEPAATVYVDDSWVGTAFGVDPDGAGPATAFGLDAFAKIQHGVNAVASGGTVLVAAGTYAENVAVNKAVDMRGPNYGVSPNTGTRVAEAVVVPGTSAISTGEILAVSASNVSINGFTVDGDNTSLTSGYLGTNGADIDAAEGVTVYFDNVNNLNVSKNIFKNLSYFGVTLFGASYSAPATTGHLVDDNKFTDFGTYDAGSGIAKWGGGVLLYNNQYTRVTGNVMTNVRLGVQTGNFSRANTGAATYQVIDGNSMQVRRVGIFHNLHYGPTSPYTLSNNTITGLANVNEVGVRGILLSSRLRSVERQEHISCHHQRWKCE